MDMLKDGFHVLYVVLTLSCFSQASPGHVHDGNSHPSQLLPDSEPEGVAVWRCGRVAPFLRFFFLGLLA